MEGPRLSWEFDLWLSQMLSFHARISRQRLIIGAGKRETLCDYSIFTGFYDGLRGAYIVSYRLGSHIRTKKAKRCLVRVRIDPIPPKGLPRLPTCHRQRSSTIAAMTS